MAIEVKRNCVRVTERGEEACSEAASERTEIGYEAEALGTSVLARIFHEEEVATA